MPDTLKLPGGHGLDKKQTIALVAGIGLVGGYVLLKHRSAGAVVPSTTGDPTANSPDGSSSYDSSSYDSGLDSGLYPYGGSTAAANGYYDPYSGQYIGTGVGNPGPVVTAVSTNAAWAQQVEAYLSTMGYNPMSVGNAIGKYLSGQGLTPNQESIVQAGIAAEGEPPQPVPPPHLVPDPGHKPVSTTIANGKQTLFQIAHAHGDTEQELIHLNPHLGVYWGTKKPVKKGTKVKV